MTKGDQLVERGATRLQELADRAAARGDGIGEWLSEELRNDAAFLRKLKPSLVKARARGNGPTNEAPANPVPEAPPPAVETPVAESQPTEVRAEPPPKPKSKATEKPKKRRAGPPPVVIVGVALVVGIAIAKIVDWRGHAHPRD